MGLSLLQNIDPIALTVLVHCKYTTALEKFPNSVSCVLYRPLRKGNFSSLFTQTFNIKSQPSIFFVNECKYTVVLIIPSYTVFISGGGVYGAPCIKLSWSLLIHVLTCLA